MDHYKEFLGMKQFLHLSVMCIYINLATKRDLPWSKLMLSCDSI